MRYLLMTCLLLPVMALTARAQLCNGSLGDPVVHITFGSGNNPGASLSAAATSYSFAPIDCPNDGSYTVRNATNGCFQNSWHSLTSDHTPGDQNGYFMLVNASFQAGDFYVDTVRGLCNGTTYEFAAWIMNVLRTSGCGGNGIKPDLTFSIETTTGTVLATYNTGNIIEEASPTWKQYGLFFTMPAATTSVVVRITNKAPGGCGNDLALDDITFRPCGPLVQASLTITGTTTAALCEGDPAVFNLGSSYSAGYNNPVFQWQQRINNGAWTDINGATGSSYIRLPTAPGIYDYRLSLAESTNAGIPNCRVASNPVTITVYALPTPQLRDTTEACENTTAQLTANGGLTYNWQGPNSFTSTSNAPTIPGVQLSDGGKYYVHVTGEGGCSQDDSTQLVIHPAVSATISNHTTAICEGTGITLQASGGSRYLWQPAAGLSASDVANPFASPADTTTYQVTVFSQYGCYDTAFAIVNIWKKPVADAGPDKRTREGVPVTLDGSAKGTNVSYAWSRPDFLNSTTILHPVTTSPEDITYTLQVSSNLGCGTSSDQVFVRIYQQLKIPNAFSPNGDGLHDTWQIEKMTTYPEAEVQVFDRQGQLLFQSRGYSRPWDGTYKGKPLPTGTYYYLINLKTDIFPPISGWLQLVK